MLLDDNFLFPMLNGINLPLLIRLIEKCLVKLEFVNL